MKLLLDTHILLWAAGGSPRLSAKAKNLIEDETNSLTFSTASIWEIVIKHMLGREISAPIPPNSARACWPTATRRPL